MSFLELSDLTKSFGDVQAVRSASLQIEKNELFFLVGPSGCGKTTVLRIIAGLEQPDWGRLLLEGHEITDLPPHERRMGVVFQQYALWPHMTVRRNLSFGLELQKLSTTELWRRVDDALAVVRLESYADRYPHQLSGGQQQRVAIARALALSPQLILLDEPLSNLDAALRHEVREELQRIQRELGMTMLVVSHDQHEALSTATRLAVMHSGRILQSGTAEELYEQPQSRFVAGFLGSGNLWSGTLLEQGPPASVKLTESLTVTVGAQVEGSRGTPLSVLVRPERVRFDAEAVNRMSAVVRERSFFGSFREYLLETESGLQIRKRALASEAPDPARGTALTVSFAAEDLRVLPAAAEEGSA